jgi:hypothetical protein
MNRPDCPWCVGYGIAYAKAAEPGLLVEVPCPCAREDDGHDRRLMEQWAAEGNPNNDEEG